jgi:hypothetical protein
MWQESGAYLMQRLSFLILCYGAGENVFFYGEIQEVSLGLDGNTDANVSGVGGKPDAAAVCANALLSAG